MPHNCQATVYNPMLQQVYNRFFFKLLGVLANNSVSFDAALPGHMATSDDYIGMISDL